ncbi:hypothetical protein PRIC2_011259 [Phytophthora ramorum]
MEGLPTLIVPDDPETGVIERPDTPPPIQIDEQRLLTNTVHLPVKLQALPNAPIAPETFVATPGSKQGTPRQPTAREDPDSKQATPRQPTARSDAQPPGSVKTTPRQPSVHEEEPPLPPVLVIADSAPFESAVATERPQSARAASLNSKDFKAMAKRAAAAAKLDRLAAGNKSVFDANMNDIAALGIGLELYFLLVKYLGWAFFAMGIVSLPAIVVNYFGNGVTAKMADPLQLAYASLGNQGVNPDVASDPSECLPLGDIDCTGATVNTPFTTDPDKVAWIVTSSDAIYSFVFLVVYLAFRRHARRAIEAHQNEHLTPAKYAVFVRGLPSDAASREVLEHFNALYDPTQEERYFPLWLGCCWGRRPRRVKHSLSKGAVNCNVVRNLDHLWRPDEIAQARPSTAAVPGTPRPDARKLADERRAKEEQQRMYLGTWIAEVSIAHPTGGLLRTFLAMEVLTRKISEAQALVGILTHEKEQAEIALQNWTPPPGKRNPKKPKSSFKQADELLLQATTKKLELLQGSMAKKTSKLKALKQANRQVQEEQKQLAAAAASDTTPATTKAKAKTKRKKAPAAKPFDLTACECAFVVFNNLESRRRCLQDYRRSNQWLPLKFQPKALRFRDGKFPLTVLPAPRAVQHPVGKPGAAQSAQQTFKDKAPPAGLCEATLPEIFYASPDFTTAKVAWDLEWNPNATCTAGESGEERYHVAYSNGILNGITVRNPTLPVDQLNRCTDPCVSEKSTARSSFGRRISRAAASSLIFLAKNAFIVVASAVVVVVNIVLKTTLRGFASFERHASESAKASAVALKMFAAQFLNTAIIVLVVNAALSLSAVPVIGELFRGKFSDFQRDWYPTVGMGVTMTMLINAVVPQAILLLNLCLLSPLKRCIARRSVRTQEKMDQLYAGPTFDLAVRYPMVLNSVFVTLVFCGGSPVLLFIAALACTATFWLDKLALLWLYSVKTAYDEDLGETVLGLLPWALVAHLGFSSWMYGNTDLLSAPTLKLGWVFKLFGLSTDGATNTEDMYSKLVAQAASFDPLGKHGFIVKVLHVNVMLMFILFVLVLVGILLSAVWTRVLLPVLRHTVGRILLAIWRRLRPLFRFCRCRCSCFRRRKNAVKPVPSPGDPPAVNPEKPPSGGRSAKVAVDIVLTDIPTSAEPTTDAAVGPPAVGNGKEDGDVNGASWTVPQPLVQKSSVVSLPPVPTAWAAESAALAPTETLQTKPPVSARPVSTEVVLPEFTDFFRKSVGPKFRADAKLGFKRDSSRPSELVRLWQEETISNGLRRTPGDSMLTWEAIQAPVKTYAIEANAKYRLAVAELVAASKRALTIVETPETPSKPDGVVAPVAAPPVEPSVPIVPVVAAPDDTTKIDEPAKEATAVVAQPAEAPVTVPVG